MILGVSTQNWCTLLFCEQLQAIAKLGFRYVNIHLTEVYNQEEIDDAIKCIKQLHLIPGQMSSSLFPDDYLDEEDYEKAKMVGQNLINIQAQFGGKQISINAGTYSSKKANHLEASVKLIQELCDFASELDQIIALNMLPKDHQLVGKWEDALELYTQVDRDNFMINIDIGYENVAKEPMRSVDLLKGKLPQCKISDNDGISYQSDLNIGEGTADIKEWTGKLSPLVKETCDDIGDHPAAVLMFHDADDAEVKRTLKYMQEILPKLTL